jgi:hypothetical protein
MNSQYTVTMSMSAARTRILLTDGDDELMRAVLPPMKQVLHDRAAHLLLEGLALWLDQTPHVVVSAGDADATFFFGLTDELGNPRRGLFYEVEVVDKPVRRRGKRIAGLGPFGDLRQLSLLHGGVR